MRAEKMQSLHFHPRKEVKEIPQGFKLQWRNHGLE
jgi:hypothetical protein